MSFELNALSRIICNEWKAIQRGLPEPEGFHQLIRDTWQTDYRCRVLHGIHASASGDCAALYISGQQAALTSLSDELLAELEPETARAIDDLHNTDPAVCRYRWLIGVLNDLLRALRRVFPQQYNMDLALPGAVQPGACRTLLAGIRALRARLLKQQADPKLVDLLMQPALNSCAGETPLTCRALEYQQLFLRQMTAVANMPPEGLEGRMWSELLYLNYNDRALATWWLAQMKGRISALEPGERPAALAMLLRDINQAGMRPGAALRDGEAPLPDMLAGWIIAEMNCAQPPQPACGLQAAEPDMPKIESALSVPQIACLLRLMVDTGMIVAKNQTALLHFCAAMMTTPRQETISGISLRAKYYSPDRHTIEAIRDLLMKLFNQSKKLAH